MHLVSALMGTLAVVLYGYRTGMLSHSITRAEKVARVGLGLTLTFVTVGFFERFATGAPFEPIHWPILGALSITVGGYVGLFSARKD